MQFRFHVTGGDFSSAGTASSEIKKVLKKLNVDGVVIKRAVVSLYEAEVNVVAHAFEGDIFVNISSEKISILLKDKGPGIVDISKAMEEGFSTASPQVREMGFGAGMGLPNIKRNSDFMDIQSVVGEGTTLQIEIYINNKNGEQE
ncbi:anti-sigma regulatory factor [bacterium]|nr:anti-sigma regulatory factor [bacterium]